MREDLRLGFQVGIGWNELTNDTDHSIQETENDKNDNNKNKNRNSLFFQYKFILIMITDRLKCESLYM